MIWLLIALCVVAGFAGGLAVGWYTTSMRIWSLESKFRALALEFHDYSVWEHSETLPSQWVREQLDSFIAKEFR